MKLITVYRGINKLAPFTAIFRFARLEPNGTKLIILPERHSKYKIQEKKIYHQTELENLSLGLGTHIISRDNQRKNLHTGHINQRQPEFAALPFSLALQQELLSASAYWSICYAMR